MRAKIPNIQDCISFYIHYHSRPDFQIEYESPIIHTKSKGRKMGMTLFHVFRGYCGNKTKVSVRSCKELRQFYKDNDESVRQNFGFVNCV